MKVLRVLTVLLFIGTACLFGWYYVQERNSTDYTLPTIQAEQELLEISIHDDESVLLQGITAFDAKDGDLTDKVIVESISQFVGENTCTVTYAVADSDKHVAKCTRQIRYIDYEKPHFYLKKPMVISLGSVVEVTDYVGATDCIEGDITDRVIITATDYQAGTAGVYSLSLQATNAKGDIVYLNLSMYVEEENLRAPVITLSNHLIYVDKGQELDFESFVTSVESAYNRIDEDSFLISESYNPNTPGVYDVHYYVLDTLGNEEHTVLTVVVEE